MSAAILEPLYVSSEQGYYMEEIGSSRCDLVGSPIMFFSFGDRYFIL